MTTFKFADGRIKLFNYIMSNLGSYTCFKYGDTGIRVSIAGNEVSFCSSTWETLWTTTID